MKKNFLFLFVFILIASICFFNPAVKQGFAEGEKKVVLKGVIRGAGEPNFLDFASSVDVSGNYAYVIGWGDFALSIFDISDPSKPALVNSIKVRSDEDKNFGADSVCASGNFAYVHVNSGVVLIYDISDPAGTGPQLKGKVSIYSPEKYSAGHIYVKGILAYVVDTVSDGLTIVDVSDKANPLIIGSITGAGSPNYLENPSFVTVSNDFAYIVSADSDALTIINVKNPKNPILASVIKGAGAPNYLNGAGSVFLDNNYAYVASMEDAALSIIDITNPMSPVFAGFISGKGKPNYLLGATDVEVVNNYAFVSGFGDNAIPVYNVADAAKPVLADVIKGSGKPNYLYGVNKMNISGNYLYAASSGDDALVVFDISAFTAGSDEGVSETAPGTAGADDEAGTIDNGEVSILRQWLRIHNPNSI